MAYSFERKLPPGFTKIYERHMILLKTDVLKSWLRSISRNQEWLARKIDVSPGYLSLIVNNNCKISREIIELFLEITHAKFETLFDVRPEPDDRDFYGDRIWFRGKLMKRRDYYKSIANQKMLENIKNNVDKAA